MVSCQQQSLSNNNVSRRTVGDDGYRSDSLHEHLLHYAMSTYPSILPQRSRSFPPISSPISNNDRTEVSRRIMEAIDLALAITNEDVMHLPGHDLLNGSTNSMSESNNTENNVSDDNIPDDEAAADQKGF